MVRWEKQKAGQDRGEWILVINYVISILLYRSTNRSITAQVGRQQGCCV